jgi:hypothetical protein
MAKIVSAVAESVEPQANVVYILGERGARRINDGWKGDFVADATTAAFQYGLLVSARMLTQDRAEHLLRFHFDHRKVEPDYWSPVWQSFLCGRDSGITNAELRERMATVAASNTVFFDPTPFEFSDPSKIPLRDWIYGKYLLRGIVSMTIASGAVGKTSLKIVEALALATGRPLLGVEVPKPCRVWLFNLEDSMIELRRRVSAAMMHYNIKQEDIGNRLLIDAEKSLVITKTDKQGTKIEVPIVEALVEAVQAREIDVLTVDPFISSHDAPENDNGAMDLVMKSGWIQVSRLGDCSVNMCHHTTKVDAGTATAMSGRGGGSVVAAARSAQVLNNMSPEDAVKAGLESPVGYFNAIYDKENNAPQSSSKEWYKIEGISLGNGGKGNIAQLKSDHVGVVTRWDWPSNASFTEDVTSDQLQAIKNRLLLGEHRESEQARDWAGKVVAQILGIDVDDKAGKARVVRMLKTWIKEGHLEVYTKNDANRISRDFIRTP